LMIRVGNDSMIVRKVVFVLDLGALPLPRFFRLGSYPMLRVRIISSVLALLAAVGSTTGMASPALLADGLPEMKWTEALQQWVEAAAPTVIPEPALHAAVLTVGVLGWAWLSRRRRRPARARIGAGGGGANSTG